MSKSKIILLGIVMLAATFRLWDLGGIPKGFIPEEVSSGWNAYSILKTGRDEWGTFLPLLFRETGGYKLALGSYLMVPSIAIFGLNEFAVRLPATIAGISAVIGTYLFVLELFKSKKIALSAAFLLAVSPWHIAMGRYSVDVNWGVFFFLFGIYFFLRFLQNPKFLVISGICFVLTYFTYFNYVVFTVLMLVGMVFLYRKDLFNYKWRKYTALFILIQFLGLSVYIFNPALFTRFSQATSVDRIGFINRINERRGACETTYPAPICRAAYNKYSERLYETIRNYTEHFATTIFFVRGSKMGLSGMPDNWGLMYVFEFPLIIVGIFTLIYRRKFPKLLWFWIVLYGIPGSLASGGHIWRMMTILPIPQFIAGIGLVELFKRSRLFILSSGIIAVIAVLVTRFWVDYSVYFPYSQSSYSYYGFRELYKYVLPLAENYPYILVSPAGLNFEQLYIYYLFYSRYDPYSYQQGIDLIRQVGRENWVEVSRIGKWHFISDIRNVKEYLPDRVLYIADGSFSKALELPQKLHVANVIHEINYPNGDKALQVVELTR